MNTLPDPTDNYYERLDREMNQFLDALDDALPAIAGFATGVWITAVIALLLTDHLFEASALVAGIWAAKGVLWIMDKIEKRKAASRA